MYAFSENFILPLSHDEVVHGKGSLYAKMPGDRWQKLANLRALYAYMWAHPGKKLLFMGGEIAQEQEWSYERSLDWHLLERPEHAGVQALVRDLNHAYRDEPALWERRLRPDGLLLARGQRRATATWSRSRAPRRTASALLVCVGQPLAGPARALPPRAAAVRPLARGCSTPTRRSTAAATSATCGGDRRRSRSAGTASRSRPRSRCRRSASSGWCRTRTEPRAERALLSVGTAARGLPARRRPDGVPRLGAADAESLASAGRPARELTLEDAGLGVYECVTEAAPRRRLRYLVDGTTPSRSLLALAAARAARTVAGRSTCARSQRLRSSPRRSTTSSLYELHVGTFTPGGHVRRARSPTSPSWPSWA